MPASTYLKPDVEVLQEFRNLNPVILRATLQTVIVGPSYQTIKDKAVVGSTEKSIGAYAKIEVELPFPTLSPGAKVIENSLGVKIKNYAGEHVISPTVLSIQGNSGSFAVVGTDIVFTDNNQDFVASAVHASTGVSDHDGDFVHVLTGAAAGYYEIQSVTDGQNVIVDDPDGVLAAAAPLSGLDYTIGNFGWLMTETGVLLSPRLSDSGVVYLSGLARRVDYVDRFVVAETLEELENIFGQGDVALTNPLAYGMSKALIPLGRNEIVLGVMVEDDSVLSYQKAFELLETEDVYCIVPLTTNPIVHQILSEHVNAMSAVEQKMERIGLFNTAFRNRIVKQGYFGRQDPITSAWALADGDIVHTGTALNDVDQFLHHGFTADGSSVAQSFTFAAGYNRLVTYFRPNIDFVFEYSKVSAPATFIDATSLFNADGIFELQLSGDSIATVRFTSSVAKAKGCEVFVAKTTNLPAGAEIFYPVVIDSGIQMSNPYLNPTAGHRTLKIRHFDFTAPAADPLVGTLPEGMDLLVTYGNGSTSHVVQAGTHSFSGDIVNVYVSNSTGANNADNHLIEVMVLQNAGTYKVNQLYDEQATFLSAGLIPGEDELVIIDTSVVDDSTFSKFKETKYQVSAVVDEATLQINKVWNATDDVFDLGEFPAPALGVHYRVETPIITNKYELAKWIRDISKGFANRRMTHIFAPAVGITDDGITITPIAGYYFSCVYAGATQSDPPQNGFTNRPFAGFAKVFFTNDYFTEAQMNIIAEGGTTIVVQPRVLVPLSVRHQLTTDMTSIETREYSVTKDLDYMAKTARISFRPYIGRFLITQQTLSMLYKLGSALVQRWIADGQLISGSVDQFVVDPTQADKVLACFFMKVPIPLNFIRLIFVI